MTTLKVTDDLGREVVRVRFKRVMEVFTGPDEYAVYSAEFAIEAGNATILKRTLFRFPAVGQNAASFIKTALATLNDEDLEYKGEPDSSDMARKIRRALPEVPGEA